MTDIDYRSYRNRSIYHTTIEKVTRYHSLARYSREELFGQHTRSRTSFFFRRLLVTKFAKTV